MRSRFHFSVYSLMLQFWCISGTLKVLLPGLLWRTPRKMKLKLMTIGMTLQMMTRPFLLTMQNPKGETPWLPWKSSFREKNHVSKLSYWPPSMVIVGAISDLTTFTFSPLLNCYLNNQTQNLLWWPVFIHRVSNNHMESFHSHSSIQIDTRVNRPKAKVPAPIWNEGTFSLGWFTLVSVWMLEMWVKWLSRYSRLVVYLRIYVFFCEQFPAGSINVRSNEKCTKSITF